MEKGHVGSVSCAGDRLGRMLACPAMSSVRFPHPLALLTGCIFIAAACSYLLPAGQYERHQDAATGRQVVLAGTYHRVDPSHVGPFQAIVRFPRV